MSYLHLDNVSKIFAPNAGVFDINLDIDKGEAICLLGSSGCGKTTLLRLISGLLELDVGEITLDGQNLVGVPPHKRDIGFVFQTWALFPHLSVFRNVEFGLTNRNIQRQLRVQRVREMLNLVGLSDLAERKPTQLSGGQQQRVALARALAISPRILLLDEPMSSLDFNTRVELRQELRSVQQKLGLTAIYVTHDYSEALAVSDRTVLLHNGVVVEHGPTKSMFERPKSSYGAEFFGLHNVMLSKVIAIDGIMVTVEVMPGRVARLKHDQAARPITVNEVVPVCFDQWSGEFLSSGNDSDCLRGTVTNVVAEHGYTRVVLQLIGGTQTIAARIVGLHEIRPGLEASLRIDWLKAWITQS